LKQVAGYTYNTQHRPLTYTDAANKVWNYAWNTAGQLIYATNPLRQTRFWEYDTQGRLVKVTIPKTVTSHASVVYGTTNAGLAAEETRNYTVSCAGVTPPANSNLPISITDSGGRALCFQYDALDRVTKIKYPDSTTEVFSYAFPNTWPVVAARGKQSLDLWKHTDRLGRVTSYSYDQNRRLTAVKEPVTVDGVETTRTTRYEYYENGVLKNLIDANGNVTHWEIDIQSRPTSKTYAYGTADAQTESYTYDLAGRLRTVKDAKGQVLTKTYNVDDTLAGYAYKNATMTTPGAKFTYDPYVPRLTKMTDQFGTTVWTYKPIGTNGALRLDTETPPFANATASYGYDDAGRVNSLTVPGAKAETFAYDVLGRLKTHVTALGTLTYGYLGNTGQPTSQNLTNGAVKLTTNWGYDTNANDRRLKSITHSGATRSYGFDYLIPPALTANNPYAIMQMTETMQGNTQSRAFAYDGSDRLLEASSVTLGDYRYGYDKLDNITSYNENDLSAEPSYNGLNQLKQFWWWQNFDYDLNGNTEREYNESNVTLRGYTYDAADRIVKVTNGANTTEYRYDGLGRRIKSLTTSGGVTTESRYLWCGSRLCQQRDGQDVAQTRFYPEGEYKNAQGLLYITDHLGGVRDVMDTATGAVVGSLDYTPYGAVTKASGIQPGFQYAGLLWDGTVGLSLSTTRFYDAGTGRWLNRDPIREYGGINLYGYVEGNPIIGVDPLGLEAMTIGVTIGWQGGWLMKPGYSSGVGYFLGIGWSYGPGGRDVGVIYSKSKTDIYNGVGAGIAITTSYSPNAKSLTDLETKPCDDPSKSIDADFGEFLGVVGGAHYSDDGSVSVDIGLGGRSVIGIGVSKVTTDVFSLKSVYEMD